MSIYSEPPPWREFRSDKPTLLVCWWITIFCTVVILLRVVGRFIRMERLFTEDRVAALALIPLFIRMGCVQYILRHGTNNARLEGRNLSESELRSRQIASGLVLASRIFYAATLWILKFSILEYLKRLTGLSWERSHKVALLAIQWILVATFVAVVISDLTECRPFNNYWQVLPDPGGQCRQGFAQLITMGACNIFTDILLAVFPIPIIIRSHMTLKRKVQLVLLFSMSLTIVVFTFYRVPRIIHYGGLQQFRSLLASIELVIATTSTNALVLGSFVRDRGVKKQKFRRTSMADSFDRASSQRRRPMLHRHWGSDEDLVRDVGMSLDPELRDRRPSLEERPVPAPVAPHFNDDLSQFGLPKRQRSTTEQSEDSLLPRDQMRHGAGLSTPPRRLSFFDVGGLLEESAASSTTNHRPDSRSTNDTTPPYTVPSASLPASSTGIRRGSTALLQDLGGLLGPLNSRPPRTRTRLTPELQTIPQSNNETTYNAHGKPDPVLMDAGGLLK
ncbi:hypothetical protein HJFPF1_00548 [Paramyrothecium foliicola]|nr:hypothetical protein HJFPF1_00548 [Paramyrothecium foliicola]